MRLVRFTLDSDRAEPIWINPDRIDSIAVTTDKWNNPATRIFTNGSAEDFFTVRHPIEDVLRKLGQNSPILWILKKVFAFVLRTW